MQYISVIITFASLITGVAAAVTVISKVVSKKFNQSIKPLKDMIESQNAKIEEVDVTQCQTFILQFIDNVESGITMNEATIKHAYRLYDKYVNVYGRNSYVHDRWEEIVKR